MDRRAFLRGVAAAAVGGVLSPFAQADGNPIWTYPRELAVRRDGVGTYRILFWEGGQFINDGYVALCHMLSDVKESVAVQIDPGLMNLLWAIQTWAKQGGNASPLTITSGYRTPEHNSHLEGAAKNSMHIHGRAADIRIPGMDARTIANMAAWFRAGGVGWYPSSNFTHVDTGNVRYWTGR